MEEAYKELRDRWAAGERDREEALQLLFLSWMHWADPSFVNGMSDDPDANELWHIIFDYFGGEASSDAEFLHVTGLMAVITPWALGDDKTPWPLGDDEAWAAMGKRMTIRSLQLQPDGFPLEMFEGRSDYGRYFAHQARGALKHR